MSVYSYIAESNPNGAISVINSFGYDLTDSSNLGKSLSELVAAIGEPAFKKVMDLHPDKDVLLELYESDSKSTKIGTVCGCDRCRMRGGNSDFMQYFNADGSGKFADEKTSQSVNTTLMTNQTNLIFGVSALLIAFAIILKTK
jgi:hypothetical protein